MPTLFNMSNNQIEEFTHGESRYQAPSEDKKKKNNK